MKRKFTKLMAALALLVFMMPSMAVWGQTRTEVVAYTLDGTQTGGSSGYDTESDITQNNVSWKVKGNTTMNPWRIGGKSISNVDRPMYSTTPIADNITKIEVTHGTASGITVNSWTVIIASDASFTNVVSTLTPTFTASATTTINRPTGADWTNCYYKFIYNVSVTQTSNKFVQFVEADFYKQEGSGTVIATPTFNPAGGSYTTTQNVTISCETQGSTIYYTTDGTTPDNNSTQYNGAITVSETTTIKAIAYVGNDASSVASATYTIVQPLTTMQAIFDRATEVGSTATYTYITLGDWVVSGVSTNGKNVFVTDGTKGFVIFDNGANMGFAAGDILSGTVYCKVQLYNGFAELTLLNSTTDGVSVTTGGTVTAANIAMANLAGVNTGALVHYENLTCSIDNNKYYLSDGTTTIQVYNTLYAFGTLTDGKTYNITGIYQQYNSTKEILPRSTADIEEVVSSTPTIYVAPISLSGFTYEEGNGPSTAKMTYVSGNALTEDISLLLNDNSDYEMSTTEGSGYTNNLTLTQTGGTVNATTVYVRLKADLAVNASYSGTITLSSASASDVTVSLSGSVTAPEAPHVTWDLSIASYDEIIDPDIVTWSSSYATMTNSSKSGGTSASNYLGGDSNNRTSSRFYSGNTLTLSPALGYTISSVVFEATSNGYATALKNSTWTNATAAMEDGNTVTTVTVTPTDGTINISAVIGGTCGFTAVTVYYETVAPVAPVWSTLPTPTVNVGEDYDITLSGYVSGTPAPTITLTSAVDGNNTDIASSLYDYDDGLLMFQPDAAGTFTFTFAATNTAGSATASLVITAIAPTPTITVAPTIVNATAAFTEGEIAVTYTAIETSTGVEIIWCDANGDELQDQNEYASWLTADFATNDINTIEYIVDANDGAARTAYLKVYALDNNGGDVYSNLVTINQAAYVTPSTTGNNYELYSGALVEGDYVIYYDGYALKNEALGTTGRLAYETVSPANDVIATADATIVWHIAPSATEGYWTIYSDDAQAYAASTGAKNKAQMLADGTDDKALWSVTVAESKDNTYEFVNKYNYDNNVNHLLRNNGTNGFACYSGQTGGTLSLYKKVTYDLFINGYTSGTNGWNLIASPVSTTPSEVENMLTDETQAPYSYDLYRFNQAGTNGEWENYHQHQNDFTITPGKGYLYANSNSTTLKFSGELYDGDGTFALTYDGNATFAGWNLVGNPFTVNANVDKDFYIMNEAGSEIVPAGQNQQTIASKQGIFVQATATDQSVTFTAASKGVRSNDTESVVLNLMQDGKVSDRAIVRFNDNRQLSKFQLFENSTKLCIAQNGEEFAIASAEAQGEMPVNFKASKDGSYTITVDAENLEMDYLHLIDNMTGANVDLLATPSYTFEAKTTDYASRFRLVFSANNATNEVANETFAFFNGSEWMISNTGNATLQVIDVLGRVLSSETISGTVTVSLKETSGVYMLRLVNGNDVKVQKVVVR